MPMLTIILLFVDKFFSIHVTTTLLSLVAIVVIANLK
jgi:hypothetical protein